MNRIRGLAAAAALAIGVGLSPAVLANEGRHGGGEGGHFGGGHAFGEGHFGGHAFGGGHFGGGHFDPRFDRQFGRFRGRAILGFGGVFLGYDFGYGLGYGYPGYWPAWYCSQYPGWYNPAVGCYYPVPAPGILIRWNEISTASPGW